MGLALPLRQNLLALTADPARRAEAWPVWSRHVGDPVLESDITRRVDFALFMVEALENDDLVHEAPAIVSRQSPSALGHAAA